MHRVSRRHVRRRFQAPLHLLIAALVFWAVSLGVAWPAHAQTPDDLPTRLPGHTLAARERATPDTEPHGAAAAQAGTAAASQPITLTIVLNRTDQKGFDQYLADVQDPLSSNHP